MTEMDNSNEDTELLYLLIKDSHLLTPVVLIGASALIPIPFADDMVKVYLEKRLFSEIAEKEGVSLSKEERSRLTQTPSKGCCALGCLSSAFLYPVKRVLRKLFYFLEIKRSVDQASTALAQAWLFQLTLHRGLWKPGGDIARCDQVRTAINAACHSHGVKPLETAIKHAFAGTKGTLKEFAGKFSKKSTADEAEFAQAVEKLEEEQKEKLAGITQRLSDSLGQVSDSYLVRFAETFEQHLAVELAKPLDLPPSTSA